MRKTLELNEADEALLAVVVEHMESMALIKPRKGRDVQTTKPFRLLLKMYRDIYIDGNTKIAGDSTNLVLKELAEMQKKLTAIQIDSAQTRFDSVQNLAVVVKTNSAVQQIGMDTKSLNDSLDPVLIAENVSKNIKLDLEKTLTSKTNILDLGLRNIERSINRESELNAALSNHVVGLSEAVKNQGRTIPEETVSSVNEYTKKMLEVSVGASFGLLAEKIESVLLMVIGAGGMDENEIIKNKLRGIHLMNEALNVLFLQINSADVAKTSEEKSDLLKRIRMRSFQKKHVELYEKMYPNK